MRKLLFFVVIITFCVVANTVADVTKLFSKDWLKNETLKTATLASYIASQSLSGITEGYKFRAGGGGAYLMNEDNYHYYETLQRMSWITTGFFTQMTVRSSHLKWHGKVRRIIGSALIARNAFEWSYKWQRYNNPFNYTPEYNRHAVVYFSIRNGQCVDLYVGTGHITGPIVDALFFMMGCWILK